LHDVGNALVGFGAHVTRINRSLEQNNQDNMQNLSVFLKSQQQAIAGAIGHEQAAALTVIAEGLPHHKSKYRGYTPISYRVI